jgi:hypothetical protein
LHDAIPPLRKFVAFYSFFSLLLELAFLFFDEVPFVQQELLALALFVLDQYSAHNCLSGPLTSRMALRYLILLSDHWDRLSEVLVSVKDFVGAEFQFSFLVQLIVPYAKKLALIDRLQVQSFLLLHCGTVKFIRGLHA